jgi:predicted regulator of Ras-like GTPase activity (Roadblock/LC7/MglB family)
MGSFGGPKSDESIMSAMSQSATIRFFGVLKNWFSRPDNNGNGAPQAEPSPNPVPTSARPVPPPAPAANHNHQHHQNGNSIVLPLQVVIMAMSPELRAKIRAAVSDDLTVSVPLDKIIPQLVKGAVKIPFGDIRRSAPQIFAPGTDCDHLPVALPLSEILSRINPTALSRRPVQKQTQLSDDVVSPFNARGRGLTILNEPAKPVPALHPARPLPRAVTSYAPRPVAPSPAPVAPPRNSMPSVTLPAPPSFAPISQSRHIQMPAPAPVATATPVLVVSLASLAEGWPEKLRQELVQLNLVGAQVALPADLVEAGLKRGRVTFLWKTLRSWVRPTPRPGQTLHDEMELELPLKVIAPIFLARQKAAAKMQPQKVAMDESIPNLFFGFPQPESPAPVAAAPVAPAPAPPAALVPPAKPVDTNYYVWNDNSDTAFMDESQFKRKPITETEFLRRFPTPNELVARAAELPGVTGAIIALPDGLKVASHIPADQNGETLAAFLPQLFIKMSQCTKELRMGELNNLNFTVGNVPWKIFRVNAVFFAAFGRVGQPLPTAQLARLAAELDRKNKQ